MKRQRRCINCQRLTTQTRCPTCRAQQRNKYAGQWDTHSRRTIAAHIATHGHTCPGWQRDPHPTTDLTLDHHVGVLCRSCNTRKRNLGSG